MLIEGVGDAARLAEVGRLGAQLILQCALADEVAAFPRLSASPVPLDCSSFIDEG